MKKDLYVRTTCSSGVCSDNCLAVFLSHGARLIVGLLYSASTRLMLLKTLDSGPGRVPAAWRPPSVMFLGVLNSADKQFCPVFLGAKVGDAVNSRAIRQLEAAFEGLPPSHTTACLHFFSTWNHLDHCTITA